MTPAADIDNAGRARSTDEGSGLIWGMVALQLGFVLLMTAAASAFTV